MEWQNWLVGILRHTNRRKYDEIDEEPEKGVGDPGLSFRDVVGRAWDEEMAEAEVAEQMHSEKLNIEAISWQRQHACLCQEKVGCKYKTMPNDTPMYIQVRFLAQLKWCDLTFVRVFLLK